MAAPEMSRRLETRLLGTVLLAAPVFVNCGGRSVGGDDVAGASQAGGENGGSVAGSGGAAPRPSAPTACDPIRDRWLLFDSDRGKLARRLYAVRGDGSDLRELLPVHDGQFVQPAISPDGALLAHVDSTTTYVHEMPSGQLILSFLGDQPAWSPDGAELAFHRDQNTWLVPLDTHVVSEVIGCVDCSVGGYQNPIFTPDGAALVVDRENQITNVDLATGAVRDIVMNWTTTMAHPAISPDGLWVAATLFCDGNSIWTSAYADRVAPCEGRLVTRGGLGAVNPAWGPGAWIAYERGAAGEPHAIYAVNAETGDECPVVTEFDNRNPAWAPEGFTPPD